MDVSLLERMVKLMAANDLNTVDVRDGDKRVILKRGAQIVAPSAAPGGYAIPHVAPVFSMCPFLQGRPWIGLTLVLAFAFPIKLSFIP